MDFPWNQILWAQLGASIDMLENAIEACPDGLWSDPSRRPEWNSTGIVGFGIWSITRFSFSISNCRIPPKASCRPLHLICGNSIQRAFSRTAPIRKTNSYRIYAIAEKNAAPSWRP